jgi:hypothetical protein
MQPATERTATVTDEDAQRVKEIDVAIGELLRIGRGTTLSVLTRISTLDLMGRLWDERAELLGLIEPR